MLGYGVEDGYDLGIGARIGATVSNYLYLGGVFVYHFGTSQTIDLGGSTPGTFKVEVNSLYAGVELGFDGNISERFVVRLYSQFGYFSAMASLSGPGGSVSDSEGRFYIGPGLLFQIDVGKVLIGADLRYLIITGDGGSEASSFGIFGTLGFRL